MLTSKEQEIIKLIAFVTVTFASFSFQVQAQTNHDHEMLKPRKQATLPEGHIYLPHEQITIIQDTSNGQRRIHLEINNSYIREREIHVLLDLKTAEIEDLVTGTYELFFTGSSLALTNRITSKKIVFEINQKSGNSSSHVQHGKVDKLVNVIGIATYFKTCPRM